MSEYRIPKSLESTVDQLASGNWTIVAGGTDVYPSVSGQTLDPSIMDISGIEGLRGIRKDRGCWRIGALTTWTDMVRADLPPAFEGLKQAARQIGSVQVQNTATLAGNLCNASPAASRRRELPSGLARRCPAGWRHWKTI
jgi:CO/xanthine dehydrogenase FAD-binding subunit